MFQAWRRGVTHLSFSLLHQAGSSQRAETPFPWGSFPFGSSSSQPRSISGAGSSFLGLLLWSFYPSPTPIMPNHPKKSGLPGDTGQGQHKMCTISAPQRPRTKLVPLSQASIPPLPPCALCSHYFVLTYFL